MPRQLTDKQAAFVVAYVACGGNGAKAAREAGYLPPERGAQEANRLLKNPDIIQAILDETLKCFTKDVPAARLVLRGLMFDSVQDSVRFQAAKALLEHGGLVIAQRHEHVLTDDRTDEEVIARIKALTSELDEMGETTACDASIPSEEVVH